VKILLLIKMGIALRGYSASDTKIKVEESGSDSPPFSSPPIFDEDLPAIVIIADNVVVET